MTLRASSAEDGSQGPASEDTTQASVVTEGAADTGVTDPPAAEGQDANSSAAKSSSADGKDAKEAPQPTLAEVIKTAAEAVDGDGKSSTPAKSDKAQAEAKAKTEEGAKPTEEKDPAKAKAEEDAKLPFHNHPRWKEVVAERDAFKRQAEELGGDAEQYRKITSFMDANELTADEVGYGITVLAMIKAGDPKAMAILDEYKGRIAQVTGDALPADLVAKVESGEMTEDAAKELSRARAETLRAQANANKAAQRAQTVTEADQRKHLADGMLAASTAWETKVRQTDPDFDKKSDAVVRYSKALMHERGFPKTVDEAQKILEDAYAEVNKTFATFTPRKAPVTPIQSSNSSKGATPAPGSLLDVVRQAAAG